jgi:hypothetical protein
MNTHNKALIAGLCGMLLSLPPALAEDRALFIGVGKYQLPDADLPGIDLDLNMMQEIAKVLGFNDSQIKVLLDEQATLANVEQTMASWLVQGVTPNDRVLIYFSGHGTRIPDENGDETDDGADEVLTMHDTALDRHNGRDTLKGVLVDDRFSELLAQIPSNNVLILVDACHSGTSTKALELPARAFGDTRGYAKFLYYKGIPDPVANALKGNFNPEARAGAGAAAARENYVLLAAARDDQKSIATQQGSLFTQGVREAIRKAAQDKAPLTPTTIREQSEAFILGKMEGKNVFNPQLSGSAGLSNQPLRLVALQDGHGPVWTRLVDAVRKANPLPVEINQPVYGEGDALVITVTLPEAGYLNVVNVGPDDQATVLFPNKFNPQNQVAPGRVTVPTEQMDFDLKAREPFGPSLVVAFLTDRPVNLYQSGEAQRDQKGNITDVFSTLSPLGVRSFQVEQKERAKIAAGMVETRVCPQRANCR